jgi:hypothetical protein
MSRPEKFLINQNVVSRPTINRSAALVSSVVASIPILQQLLRGYHESTVVAFPHPSTLVREKVEGSGTL